MAARLTCGLKGAVAQRRTARISRSGAARRAGASAPRTGVPHAVSAPSESDVIGGRLAGELEAATRAVRLACHLCQTVQAGIMRMEESADTKQDRSLVTIADYGAQAVISWVLGEALSEPFSLVAEEESDSLQEETEESKAMLNRVVEIVNSTLAEHAADLPGGVAPTLSTEQVMAAIDCGKGEGGTTGRHWCLDPVDGTLGFVKGDQYAVALALVEEGEVVLGVLGCPNMPARGDVLEFAESYSYGYSPAQVSKLLSGSTTQWHKGVLLKAAKGCGSWQEPVQSELNVAPKRVEVTQEEDASHAKFCEPVMKANSSQGFTASVASALGITSKPLRVYSQVKYGSVSRGDAEVFMKFPKASYREKTWDHAAGAVVVEEAGGVICDAGGNALDFSGRYIDGLDRGIIACSKAMQGNLLAAVASSWESSEL